MGIQTARVRGLLRKYTKKQLASEFSNLKETVSTEDVLKWSRGDYSDKMGWSIRFKLWTLSAQLVARNKGGWVVWGVFRVLYYTVYRFLIIIKRIIVRFWKLRPKSDQYRLL